MGVERRLPPLMTVTFMVLTHGVFVFDIKVDDYVLQGDCENIGRFMIDIIHSIENVRFL